VIQDLVVTDDEELFAATYGYGVLWSDDGGRCWTRMNRGLENLWVYAIVGTRGGVLYIGIWADGKGGIWRSDDGGRNWEYVAFGNRQIISLEVDPGDDRAIYAGANVSGTGSIYRTSDGGATWTVLQSFTRPVWSLAVDPMDGSHVVAATVGDGVWESRDGGLSFQPIGSLLNGLVSEAVYEVAFGPKDGPYAGMLLAGTASGVLLYDPTAKNWSPFGTGSEGLDVRTLSFVGSTIYAGTWGDGIVSYDPATGAWVDFGLADIPVVAFAVHRETKTLVVGTSGRGLFLAPNLSIATNAEQTSGRGPATPVSFTLLPNYPNPFNPRTTVPIDVGLEGRVRVAVYDVLGREVAVLTDRRFIPGRYDLFWEAGNRPSGVYVIRMETPEGTLSRTVSLLK
jgi:photosystem II stability/assembly factor-like uncharacterized protein